MLDDKQRAANISTSGGADVTIEVGVCQVGEWFLNNLKSNDPTVVDEYSPLFACEHDIIEVHHHGPDGRHYCPTGFVYCVDCDEYYMASGPACQLWDEFPSC